MTDAQIANRLRELGCPTAPAIAARRYWLDGFQAATLQAADKLRRDLAVLVKEPAVSPPHNITKPGLYFDMPCDDYFATHARSRRCRTAASASCFTSRRSTSRRSIRA
jgi:hypothetical protein